MDTRLFVTLLSDNLTGFPIREVGMMNTRRSCLNLKNTNAPPFNAITCAFSVLSPKIYEHMDEMFYETEIF